MFEGDAFGSYIELKTEFGFRFDQLEDIDALAMF
jgi:hypothetical protein